MKKAKFNKKFIPAIKRLIKFYENAEVPEDCPLCNIAEALNKTRSYKFDDRYCDLCPWVRLEGARCHTMMYTSQPPELRIDRLKRWLEERV